MAAFPRARTPSSDVQNVFSNQHVCSSGAHVAERRHATYSDQQACAIWKSTALRRGRRVRITNPGNALSVISKSWICPHSCARGVESYCRFFRILVAKQRKERSIPDQMDSRDAVDKDRNGHRNARCEFIIRGCHKITGPGALVNLCQSRRIVEGDRQPVKPYDIHDTPENVQPILEVIPYIARVGVVLEPRECYFAITKSAGPSQEFFEKYFFRYVD